MAVKGVIEALAALLEAETTALKAGDYAAAGQLAPDKVAAAAAFLGVSERADLAVDTLAAPMARLRQATESNRKALESAIAVQRDLVLLIARAAKGTASGTGYGRTDPRDTAPLALSLKA
jgi:hypothetical protein